MKTLSEKIMNFVNTKKAAYGLGDLVPVVIAFGLVAIIGGVTLLILQNFAGNGSVTSGSAAYNGIYYGISGINQIMQFLPLLALVVVAAVIIGVVVGAFVLGGAHKEGF
jgi:uncharacterized membrane protein